jgi:hypothetical protein
MLSIVPLINVADRDWPSVLKATLSMTLSALRTFPQLDISNTTLTIHDSQLFQ